MTMYKLPKRAKWRDRYVSRQVLRAAFLIACQDPDEQDKIIERMEKLEEERFVVDEEFDV